MSKFLPVEYDQKNGCHLQAVELTKGVSLPYFLSSSHQLKSKRTQLLLCRSHQCLGLELEYSKEPRSLNEQGRAGFLGNLEHSPWTATRGNNKFLFFVT